MPNSTAARWGPRRRADGYALASAPSSAFGAIVVPPYGSSRKPASAWQWRPTEARATSTRARRGSSPSPTASTAVCGTGRSGRFRLRPRPHARGPAGARRRPPVPAGPVRRAGRWRPGCRARPPDASPGRLGQAPGRCGRVGGRHRPFEGMVGVTARRRRRRIRGRTKPGVSGAPGAGNGPSGTRPARSTGAGTAGPPPRVTDPDVVVGERLLGWWPRAKTGAAAWAVSGWAERRRGRG